MTLHRIQFSVAAVVLFILLFASVVALPAGRKAAASGVAKAKVSATTTTVDWVFEGCWTQFQQGPCRDVFRDAQGNYYICRDCGTTGNPTPGKCSSISPTTLSRGFWCS